MIVKLRTLHDICPLTAFIFPLCYYIGACAVNFIQGRKDKIKRQRFIDSSIFQAATARTARRTRPSSHVRQGPTTPSPKVPPSLTASNVPGVSSVRARVTLPQPPTVLPAGTALVGLIVATPRLTEGSVNPVTTVPKVGGVCPSSLLMRCVFLTVCMLSVVAVNFLHFCVLQICVHVNQK